MTRPATLRLVQAMAICIDQRDKVGLKQGLRILTDVADDNEGEEVLRLLVKSLTPESHHWFGNLDGVRKPKPTVIKDETGKIVSIGATNDDSLVHITDAAKPKSFVAT